METDRRRGGRRQGMPKKKTFTDALRAKYCSASELDTLNSGGFVVNIVYHGKPKSNGSDAELAYLRNVVLSDKKVSLAGIPDQGLMSLCPNVVDLDLSSNCLDDWKEALTIMSHLPYLKFVNLSRNNLLNKENCLSAWNSVMKTVENLVLNQTQISWDEILLLAQHFPNLHELHVCHNGYQQLPALDTGAPALEKLKCLRMNSNNIQNWDEIWKLHCLPELDSLILSGNPLLDVFYKHIMDANAVSTETASPNTESISDTEVMSGQDLQSKNLSDSDSDQHSKNLNDSDSESMETVSTCDIVSNTEPVSKDENGNKTPSDDSKSQPVISENRTPFGKLKTLCVSDTLIDDWEHLQALSKFPALECLRIQNIKLISDLGEDEKRKLKIASLPNVRILNGSEVSFSERDKAERHFIRYFMDQDTQPERLKELEEKHGKLEPLVDIDLTGSFKPEATLTFVYNGNPIFKQTFQVKEPVGKLRLLCAEKLSLYATFKTFKLYHYSCGPGHKPDERGLQEIQSESLPMSRFDIIDGDEIHIDPRDTFRGPSGTLHYLTVVSFTDFCVKNGEGVKQALEYVDDVKLPTAPKTAFHVPPTPVHAQNRTNFVYTNLAATVKEDDPLWGKTIEEVYEIITSHLDKSDPYKMSNGLKDLGDISQIKKEILVGFYVRVLQIDEAAKKYFKKEKVKESKADE